MKRTNWNERWNLVGLEQRLEEMSSKGYQIKKVGRHILSFRPSTKKELQYRIDVMSDFYMDEKQYKEDLRERRKLCKEHGWNYAVGYKKMNDSTMKYYHVYYSYKPVQLFPMDLIEDRDRIMERVMKEERRQTIFSLLFALIQFVLYTFVGVVFKGVIIQLVEGIGVVFIAFIWLNFIDIIIAIIELCQIRKMLHTYQTIKVKKRKLWDYVVMYLKFSSYVFLGFILTILLSVNMFLPSAPQLNNAKYVSLAKFYPGNEGKVKEYISRQTSPFLKRHIYSEVSYQSSGNMIRTEIFQVYFKRLTPYLAKELSEVKQGSDREVWKLNKNRTAYISCISGGKIIAYDENLVIVVENDDFIIPKERMLIVINRIMDEWEEK